MNSKSLKIVLVFVSLSILLTQFCIVNADESVSLNTTLNSTQATNTLISGKDGTGIQLDTEYFSVNTGRFVNPSQTQDSLYEDGEGNTFGVYIQPTSSLDKNASSYYYEDIYSDDMLKEAANGFVETIIKQDSASQSFNGIDELKIIELKNSFGDTYPALFWKFSIKFSNINYFFYVYEIIDKNVMYNMTFSATSYDFLEGNDIEAIISSFKIKNYQEFDHKSKISNSVSGMIRSRLVRRLIGTFAIVAVCAVLSLVAKMKKVNKEEKDVINENVENQSVGVKPTDNSESANTTTEPSDTAMPSEKQSEDNKSDEDK